MQALTRRRLLTAAAAGAVVTATGCSASTTCPPDPLLTRTMDELGSFTGWLRQHKVDGSLGEVGWPGDPAWQPLADQWLSTLRTSGLSAYLWAAAQWWPPDHPLAFYRAAQDSDALAVPGPQAETAERSRQAGTDLGVSVADGSFGTGHGDSETYCSETPGEYGTAYIYPSAESLRFLAARGYTKIRLTVMWERLQKDPGDGALVTAEVKRVRQVLRDAAAVNLRVLLDLHNFGRFAGWRNGRRQVWALGSSDLPKERLAQTWRRLVDAFSGEAGLWAYGLMNEPHDLPGGAKGWEDASRLAVDAIRAKDRSRPIHVDGYSWSAARSWSQDHPRPWLDVPGIVYSAHQYFDLDHSGAYRQSFSATQDELRKKC